MSPSTFGKRQREQDKKAKAEAKRQRRQQGGDTDTADEPAAEPARPGAGQESTEDVLAKIAELHERYEAGTVSFDEFEATKAELMARIVVD